MANLARSNGRQVAFFESPLREDAYAVAAKAMTHEGSPSATRETYRKVCKAEKLVCLFDDAEIKTSGTWSDFHHPPTKRLALVIFDIMARIRYRRREQ